MDFDALAERTGGTLSQGPDWNPEILTLRHRSWVIRIDRPLKLSHAGLWHAYSQNVELRALFVCSRKLSFSIQPRGPISLIQSGLGLAAFKTGDRAIDKKLVIKTSDRESFKALLAPRPGGYRDVSTGDEALLDRLRRLDGTSLWLEEPEKPYADDVLELTCYPPKEPELEGLVELAGLFKALLDGLLALGIATEQEPREL